MSVKAVRNEQNTRLKHQFSTAVKAGVLSTGLSYMLYPPEVKAGIKNSLRTTDSFTRASVNCALKTINKSGLKIDIKHVCENAKKLHPEIVKAAKPAFESLGKTFVGVAFGVFVGSIISDKIIDSKINTK